MKRDKGLFITFEGIDGSGKSTQASLLFRRLKENEYPIMLTREPGGSKVDVSEKIRNIILNHATSNMDWKTELLLFMASRSQHVVELIQPNLEKGIHVICDRFADASVAYQGYGRGLDLEWIHRLNRFSCQGTWPNCTILLDITPEEFWARKKKNNTHFDRIESSGQEFQARVAEGYRELARQEPQRFVCLDGTQSPEELSNTIFDSVMKMLEKPVGGNS